MSIIWSRLDGPNGPSLSIVFPNGDTIPINKEHLEFKTISKKLVEEAPEEEIRELINPVKSIALRFQRLSERVTTDGANLFFDGDVLDDSLSTYIVQLVKAGAEGESEISWRPFVNFLEKLAQNPSQDSRESLFDFVSKWGLTVKENGDFIAYKGVNDNFTSVYSGPGIVNDKKVNGHLPNNPGFRIEIERSYVTADRDRGCAQGLHAGTYDYASRWGNRVVAVAINPRDVVSVPRREVSKLRVARYEVLIEVKKREKPAATAGTKDSALLWEGARQEALKNYLKRIKKAIARNTYLEFSYGGKKYTAKPRSVEGLLVKVMLDDRKSYRNFRLERIEGISKIAKVAEEPKAPEIDPGFLKTLQSAFVDKEAVAIRYHGNPYSGVPTSIHSGFTKVKLSEGAGYRTFRLSELEAVSKPKKPKKSKKAAKVALALTEAIDAGNTVELTLVSKEKKLIVRPRRLADGEVGVTLPAKSNRFKKIEVNAIKAVKPQS